MEKFLSTLQPKRDVMIRTAFGMFEDVMVHHKGIDYYGWVTNIIIHDWDFQTHEAAETYDVTLVKSWKGEPFKSEHKDFIFLEDVDPEREDTNMRKSDREQRV